MPKKLKVAVLMGGKSSEHDVSVASGNEVVKNLDPQKYDVTPIVLPKSGAIDFTLFTPHFDLFFIAMHGAYGEDGTIQGLLELVGVPYTGSGVAASALAMDKVYSLKLFTQAGLQVPTYVVVKSADDFNSIWKTLDVPVFVKPANHGSAIGVSKVTQKSEIAKAVREALKYSDRALVEEFIEGTEVTSAILGNDNPQILPLVEIVPKKEFFDYEAKYNEEFCDEIIPARVSEDLVTKAQNVSLKAYKTLGCQVFGRIDMIIKGKDIYILEANTIPGLTPVSLFPKAAKAAGMPFSKLLDQIINLSLEFHTKKQNP